MLLHGCGKGEERLDAELFGAGVWREIERCENFVDRRFIELVAEGADQHTAQEFATVLKQRAEKSVKEGQIADKSPFGRIGQDMDDGGVHLGSRPENLRPHLAD